MTTTDASPAIVPSFENAAAADRKLAIICSKGSLDMAYPGLILANAALGEGVETHLFFTFWGFDMINKKTMGDLKFTMLGNPATHMPQGLGGLPGMTAMATSKLKKSIADLDVPEVPEFLEQIVASGGHLWACRMSADMNHLTKDGPLRRGRGHHQRQRLHREDRGRSAPLHLTEVIAARRLPRSGVGCGQNAAAETSRMPDPAGEHRRTVGNALACLALIPLAVLFSHQRSRGTS